ncbi:hypothetical protein [Tomitella biformata]|uniref:hypothetical protein n=1 Tax=Tomitella biformata TaxID=630403 RepID=UPI0004B07D6D|nr:hypothetical protein [Tomitella biformata]
MCTGMPCQLVTFTVQAQLTDRGKLAGLAARADPASRSMPPAARDGLTRRTTRIAQ